MDSGASALASQKQLQVNFYRDFLSSINERVSQQEKFALLAFEPKDLKGLNQTFGYRDADKLLITANQIIEQELKLLGLTDPVQGTKGRQLAFVDNDSPIFLLAFHRKINKVLSYHFGGLLTFRALKVNFDDPGNTPDHILLETEKALKESREEGLDTHVKSINAESKRIVNHSYHSLKRAINHQEFVLHYQPIVCASTNKTKAFEALARWRQGGQDLAPGFFIEDLTKHGLMSEFGTYVCQKALEQHSIWASKSDTDLYLSINVSLQQLKTERFREDVLELISYHNLPPEKVQIEITEDQIEDADTLKELQQLKSQAPIRIAVDDFGSGLSNIARLRDLDIDVIKIDKSILYQCSNKSDEMFLSKLVQMCKTIAKEIIIEGVETEAQRELAVRSGVHAIQGFYYERPQPPEYIDISKF